jgi:protein SCO1/2
MAISIGESERLSETRQTRSRRAGSRFARVLALALAASLGLAACSRPPAAANAAVQTADPSQPGGPFNLVDQDGHPTDQRVLSGKWSIVFFGYTFCPDFCPTTLTTLGQTMTLLGPAAQKLQVVFITVDPDRDTPQELKTYLSSHVFPKNIIGLTGTPAQIAQAAKAYVVYYQKDGTGPSYTVDHSTALYLMDPSGHYHGVIADGLTPQEQAQQITAAMNGAA